MENIESYTFEIGDTVCVKRRCPGVSSEFWKETGVITGRSTIYFKCGHNSFGDSINVPLIESYAIYMVSFANASLPIPFLTLKESSLNLIKGQINESI